MLRRAHKLLLAVSFSLLFASPHVASAYSLHGPDYVPIRRSLPNGIDMMEYGLYWLQDMTSAYEPRDPSSVVRLMEEQAARYFDFAYMAYLIGGPEYVKLDILKRSHFQNRVRDRLFELLAKETGMYDVRMPRFRPLFPIVTSRYSWVAGGDFYHRGGPVTRLYFHFYLTPRGWRIYDVTSNGVSVVDVLRKQLVITRSRD
ncbi:MlaC protein [Thiogranum longum]|uniref:MlaC protein n=1 Tax=Thiogranum longum TaxID=1537524 RepID=A0A4R1HDZ0_9GAMM|nr:ABC transporter substrate-binding protein [Thiogranum longum]TCK18525.1 MlaC protein [Thiogranum longum]